MKIHFVVLSLILFAIFLFRLPSLFEPFWYGDEGIFAAVANNLNQDGVLYQTAWDNKPPMIYLTYAAIFKTLGTSMFSLRLVTLAVVLTTAVVIYEIAKKLLGENRALFATLIFGFLTSLRIVEGNLALTEIFMILPVSLAMMMAIFRKFDTLSLFVAGILFAIASLYKQVGAFEAVALGIFLFLMSKNLSEFIKKGLVLSLGFVLPYALTVGYFASKNLLADYIFAAYTYYRIYLGESPKYALLINLLKFLPIISVIIYGFYKKRQNTVDISHLILLWIAFSFLGSYFSGRTYGHYLVQAIPPLSLLLASVSSKIKFAKAQIIFASLFFIPLIFLTKLLFTDFLSGGPINQVKYWQNFYEFSSGKKSINSYNDFFDTNVNSIMGLADFLRSKEAFDKNVYIWGDYPWLYAIAHLQNPTRYVTSFHVFGVPTGREEVASALEHNLPVYIIKPPQSIGYFAQFEKLLSENYHLVGKIENSDVFEKR
ncbi:MAG: Glycosyl transferase, family 39 [Candidatus Curtissbacteria bacterium GW2011_GWA1_40_47]|uniref:Glycosyltransferase RgtA/B/C/D-like domain-containing protein n=1 Tax=Candidatus Curtissbacteria bacterium RIFOXYA1_FULL_41_14 TaxID=1797737 RepID=A0A1F5HB89_9BACT|nr:MAG: Glycosyl transferase, family 39 [Candidatus Curtissbacteria bacterium GW2011_GWB1_40_28]KKR64738.1 MAG: Glycosyl transferase, family 39 [Candidatus Curtissbacteria bacterium GW2011_GWA1_40_47]KKS02079.1 MAG: Glycosyl transferase, family 39 [Candidatus Curtissbacteria bacterium GW2011_GWC2_41_21]OGD78637.1 MAG: hypothetical protein A2683_02140 [Candidatus Curtissbacteria bacterium RIFCSPHIGHO2_01_FULL_34_40]OGD93434.1 MAG: hypothetical protein A3E14_01390 [Candidatus Curtissbacteria bact